MKKPRIDPVVEASALLNRLKKLVIGISRQIRSNPKTISEAQANTRLAQKIVEISGRVSVFSDQIRSEASKHKRRVSSDIDEMKAKLSEISFFTPSGPSHGRKIKAPLCDGVFMKATSVETIDHCRKYPGQVCCTANKVFRIYINGMVLAGRVGNVILGDAKPFRVQEYFGDPRRVDLEKEQFYISPTIHPRSPHARNFVNRIKYVPAIVTEPNQYTMRIGSGEHLKDDLLHIRKKDAAMFRDYVMHLLLILCKMREKRIV